MDGYSWQPGTSECTPPLLTVRAQKGSRVTPWVEKPWKQVDGTIVGLVGRQRRGPGLDEHLALVVVVWRDPLQIRSLDVGRWS